MKPVRWEFNNLHVPMMEDDQGNLFCTSKELADALQCPEPTLRAMREHYADEFAELSEISQVRNDLTIWTEDEMILAAILSKSQVSEKFRQNLTR